MRALYISHNGMLEGLGQSQVLPYLRGLARRGVDFDLLSFERPEATAVDIERLRGELDGTRIRWTALHRKMDTRFRVKIAEIARGVLHAFVTGAARRPDIVHGRSYLPTAIADAVASVLPKANLVFDCRGMLGDEYVDAGHWTTDRTEYRALKRYETRAFRRAEGVVVLTHALQRWIEEQRLLGPDTILTTIPTCVDLARFRFDMGERVRLREELGIPDERFVLVYSGSLSELYRCDEMARFAGILQARLGRPVTFLVLTGSDPAALVEQAKREGIAADCLLTRRVKPAEVASYLSAADAGISFGKACFARMGCSPTKLAEYLACGLSIITNAEFGDQRELTAERETCVVVESFTPDALESGADQLIGLATYTLAQRVARGRRVADERFGLERIGVARYEKLYRDILARRSR